jgi:hypothetical protein
MVMYRGIRKQVFYDLGLHEDSAYSTPEFLFRTTVCIMPLLSIRAAKRKIKYAEIPGDEPKRIGSERKLQVIRWGCSYLYQTIVEAFRR